MRSTTGTWWRTGSCGRRTPPSWSSSHGAPRRPHRRPSRPRSRPATGRSAPACCFAISMSAATTIAATDCGLAAAAMFWVHDRGLVTCSRDGHAKRMVGSLKLLRPGLELSRAAGSERRRRGARACASVSRKSSTRAGHSAPAPIFASASMASPTCGPNMGATRPMSWSEGWNMPCGFRWRARDRAEAIGEGSVRRGAARL